MAGNPAKLKTNFFFAGANRSTTFRGYKVAFWQRLYGIWFLRALFFRLAIEIWSAL